MHLEYTAAELLTIDFARKKQQYVAPLVVFFTKQSL